MPRGLARAPPVFPSEQVRLEELDHPRHGAVLPHVHHPWMLRYDEGGLAT